MNKWITCLALAGKCGARGASGFCASAVAACASDPVGGQQLGQGQRAEAHAGAASISRRVSGSVCSSDCLVDIHELVG